MDINFDKAIVKAIKTGNVVFGSNRSIELAISGNAKLLIIASNSPSKIMKLISKVNQNIIYIFDGTSRELGIICGKPFTVASMAIIDEGESEIISIVKKSESNNI